MNNRRWITVNLEFITAEADGEFEEDELELRKSRIDANQIVAYYPCQDKNRVGIEMNVGASLVVEGTMQSVRAWIEEE